MTFGEQVLRLDAIGLVKKLDTINEMILSAVGNPFMNDKALKKMKRSRQLEIDSLIDRYNRLED